MKPRIVLIFLLSVFLCHSCWMSRYQNEGKKYFNSYYDKNDTVYLKDYILCSSMRNMFIGNKTSAYYINPDSIFGIFKNSLEQFDFPIKFYSKSNVYCDSSFYLKRLTNIKSDEIIVSETIESIGSGKIQMVPVILIDNSDMVVGSVSPAGALNTQKSRSTFLRIIIYLTRDDQIIYKKAMFYSAKPAYVNDGQKVEVNIKQEHWNELMRRIMKEYVQRLK
jgi:hypothetical protein